MHTRARRSVATALFSIAACIGVSGEAVVADDVHRRMATTFLMTPRRALSTARRAAIQGTRGLVTGYELRRYAPLLCAASDGVHFVGDRCRACGRVDEPACGVGRQPDLVWWESIADDLAPHAACGDELAWRYDHARARPFCARHDDGDVAASSFLEEFRPWQLDQPFVYMVSRIDCAFCKRAAALIRTFSGAYPELLVLDVHADLGVNGADVRAELTPARYAALRFKRPAYACNEALTVAAPHNGVAEFLDVRVQPLVHVWNRSTAVSWGYDWRRLTAEQLPPSVLGARNATVAIAGCHDEGQRARDEAMHTYYAATAGAVANTSLDGLRAAAAGCCATGGGAGCALDVARVDARVDVCEVDDDCEGAGALSLDAVECRAAAAAEGAASFVESSLTHPVLQWNRDLDWMTRRDIRACYVRAGVGGRAFAFRLYDGTNTRRLCKACTARATATTTARAVRAPMQTLRVDDFDAVRERATDGCRASPGDAACNVDWACARDGLTCLRGAPTPNDYCLRNATSEGRCATDIDQYECEYVFRAHFRAATLDQDIRLIVNGTEGDVDDARACVLHAAGALFGSDVDRTDAFYVCAPEGGAPCARPWSSSSQAIAPPPPSTAPPPPPSASSPAIGSPSPSRPVAGPRCPDPTEVFYDPCNDPALSQDPMCARNRKWGVCGACNIYAQVTDTGVAVGCTSDADCNLACDGSTSCDGCGCSTAHGMSFGVCIANNPYDNPPTSSGCSDGVCLAPVPAKQCVCLATQAEVDAFHAAKANFDAIAAGLSPGAANQQFWVAVAP